MRGFLLASACAIACAAIAPAAAVTINFNSETGNALPSLTIGAVTFTSPGGTIHTSSFGPTPNGTTGIIGFDGAGAFPTLRADIAGGAGFVSIDLGVNNADADDLFLRAFDSSDVLLAEALQTIPGPFVGLVTLSVNAANISYVRFGGVGVAGSSVYADNFTFDGAAIPEPATWALLIGGFGMAGTAMRSRRRMLARA